MTDGTGTHNWCEICAHGGAEHTVHEAPMAKAYGTPSPVAGEQRVLMQVNYVDGDRGPLLYVGGNETDMNLDQAEQLLATLAEQIQAMRGIQVSPLPVS